MLIPVIAGCVKTLLTFNEIKKSVPGFEIDYEPDFRQKIADSWPGSIDDSRATEDWGWSAKFDLSEMARIMLENVQID